MSRVHNTKNVGPLVSSQEQSALAVPLINRSSTCCQPVVEFLHRFTIYLARLASEEMFKIVALDALQGTRGDSVIREQTGRRPILMARLAQLPRRAQPDLTSRGVSGFWVRHVRDNL